MDSYLADEITRSHSKRTFSAILIDINKFKVINDTFGHQIGDEALRDVAAILKSSVGKGDMVARLGGDEFVIISHVATLEGLEELIKTIKLNADTFNRENSRVYDLSFAVGYDVYDVSLGMSASDFLTYLDQCMYEDKHKRIKKYNTFKQISESV